MEHSSTKRQASSTLQSPMQGKRKKKRCRSEAGQIAKREADRSRAQTRINIGASAYPRWKQLQQDKGLRLDADVALLLLDTYYMLYSPLESKPRKSRPPLSSIGAESDRIKMGVTTSSDEDWYGEEEDGSDDDYVPSLCARTGGGALQRLFQVETSLPAASVNAAVQRDAPDGEEPPTPDTMSSSPEHPRVWCEDDDIVGQKAFLTYENNLRQLTTFLQLPVTKCGYLDDSTGMECDSTPPYAVHIQSRGTAAIVQWVCSREHCIWKWKSQPAIRVEALQPCLHPPD